MKICRGVRTLFSIKHAYIHILNYIQPTYIQRLLMHNTHLYFGKSFYKSFYFLDKNLFASQVFLNSSGSLLIVFGWVKDSIYLAICKEPLLFLYLFCLLLRLRVNLWALDPLVDSSESLLSSSGLGSILVLGLSFLSLDCALKNEKISFTCYFHF